jgi:hypothetical protein
MSAKGQGLAGVALLLLLAACGGKSVRYLDDDGDGIVDPDPTPTPNPTPVPVPPIEDPPSSDPWNPSATDPSGFALIGGCPRECIDCSYPGTITITNLDTGERVSPSSSSEGHSGTRCSNFVPLGSRVRIEAFAEPGRAFDHWMSSGKSPPLYWNDCPCTAATSTTCEFSVTQRTYCGGSFRLD